MQLQDLLGVWKLQGISSRGGGEVITGQTHFVVRDADLWELWPDSVYYEGDPGPLREYSFEPGTPAKLYVSSGRGRFCYLALRSGDQLRLRLGGVFGRLPESMDDEAGSLYSYELVPPEAATPFETPPAQLARTALEHPSLGRFEFDANLDWWVGKLTLGEAGLRLSVSGPADASLELIDGAHAMVSRIDLSAAAAFAAAELLEIYNSAWADDEDDEGEDEDYEDDDDEDDEAPHPTLEAASFIAKMTPESITLEDGGGITVWFDDGQLFYGHVIHVSLDPQLQPTDAGFSG